jgi:hypothetical protein
MSKIKMYTVLLLFWTLSIIQFYNEKKHFESWLCTPPQVKIPTMLGLRDLQIPERGTSHE